MARGLIAASLPGPAPTPPTPACKPDFLPQANVTLLRQSKESVSVSGLGNDPVGFEILDDESFALFDTQEACVDRELRVQRLLIRG